MKFFLILTLGPDEVELFELPMNMLRPSFRDSSDIKLVEVMNNNNDLSPSTLRQFSYG